VLDLFIAPYKTLSPGVGRLKLKSQKVFNGGVSDAVSVIYFQNSFYLLSPVVNQLESFVGNFFKETTQEMREFLLPYFEMPKSSPKDNNYHLYIMNKFGEVETALRLKMSKKQKEEEKIQYEIRLLLEEHFFAVNQAGLKEKRLAGFESLPQATREQLNTRLLQPLVEKLFDSKPISNALFDILGRVLCRRGINISELKDEYQSSLFEIASQGEFSADILRGLWDKENTAGGALEGIFGITPEFEDFQTASPQSRLPLQLLHQAAVQTRGLKASSGISKYQSGLEHVVKSLRGLLRDKRLQDGSQLFRKLCELTEPYLNKLGQYEEELITDFQKDLPGFFGRMVDRLPNRSEILIEILHYLFNFINTGDYKWLNEIQLLYKKSESVFFRKESSSRLLKHTKQFLDDLETVLKEYPNLPLVYQEYRHKLALEDRDKELLHKRITVKGLERQVKELQQSGEEKDERLEDQDQKIKEHESTIEAWGKKIKEDERTITKLKEELEIVKKDLESAKSQPQQKNSTHKKEEEGKSLSEKELEEIVEKKLEERHSAKVQKKKERKKEKKKARERDLKAAVPPASNAQKSLDGEAHESRHSGPGLFPQVHAQPASAEAQESRNISSAASTAVQEEAQAAEQEKRSDEEVESSAGSCRVQ
jgi:DNA repair exonuclease SbcCD ATPase subunit